MVNKFFQIKQASGLLCAALAMLLLAGCAGGGKQTEAGGFIKKVFSRDTYRLYRADITQGNLFDEDAIRRIKPGLTRDHVVHLLGNPVLPSMFHKDRWDYVYYLNSLWEEDEEYRITLFFAGNRVVRVIKPRLEKRRKNKPAAPKSDRGVS